MSTSANPSSRGTATDRVSTGIFLIAFLVVFLLAPFVAVAFVPAGYVYFVGPPLDFDAPHNGQVVAHIDVLGRVPPDIARIRVTEVATGVTVWDVKPTTARAECWNRCWNLTLKTGSNPASFVAGHQQFIAAVPESPSFSLTRGTAYLFEVWDSKGRVEHDRFMTSASTRFASKNTISGSRDGLPDVSVGEYSATQRQRQQDHR
jgi:hypothetical protein